MPEMTFVEKTGAVVVVLFLMIAVVWYHWTFGRPQRGAGTAASEKSGDGREPTARRDGRR